MPSAGLQGPGLEDEVWIWLPFPHLNLAYLKESVEDSDLVLGALSRLAGFDSPRELPTFGPFPLPPARDLVFAMGANEDHLRLEARVDPLVVVISRLAGKVAGNPWLSGGEIETANGTVKVEWSGTRWIASRGAPAPGDSRADFRLQDAALGAVVLSRASPPLPAGTFVLRRIGSTLEMALENSTSTPIAELSLEEKGLIFFLLEGVASGDPGGMMFFSTGDEDAIRLGKRSLSLPGAAVIHPPNTEPRDLPGQSILRLTQSKISELATPTWNVVAYSTEQAHLAASLMQSEASRLKDAENGSLEFAVSVRPADAEAEIGDLLDLLGQLPLVSKAERRKWRDTHQVLLALADLERVTMVSGTSPPSFRLVLYAFESDLD